MAHTPVNAASPLRRQKRSEILRWNDERKRSQLWMKTTTTNAGAVARARAEHERKPRGANEPAAEEDDDARANADDDSFLRTGDFAGGQLSVAMKGKLRRQSAPK